MSGRVRRIGPGGRGLFASVRDIAERRSLLRAIAVREIRLRYKQTLLGLGWAIAHPLALMLVFTAVFDRVVRVPHEGEPYPLFSYAALLPWTYFSRSVSLAMGSLVQHVDLVTKVWFPREILPLGSVLASLLDYAVAFVLFALLAWVGYGRVPAWTWLWVVPLALVQVLLAAGVSLFTAALNVRFRDVKYVVPLALQVWLYASPVIYPLGSVPVSVRGWYVLNPMAGLVESYRAVLLRGTAPDEVLLGLAAAGSVLLLVAGWAWFHRVEAHFADVI